MSLIAPSRAPRAIPRAELVGSLLRNRRLTDQIAKLYAGQTTAIRPLVLRERPQAVAELNRIADDTIADLVVHQIDAGLDVVTDGEVRRTSFLSSFYDAVDGLSDPGEMMVVHDEEGNVVYEGFNDPVVSQRLHKAYSPTAEEATFMRTLTSYPFKVTLPAPSYYFLDFVPIKNSSYTNKLELVEDATAITRTLVAEAIAAGARWIQFDFPVYPALIATTTSEWGSMLTEVEESTDWVLDKALAVDAAVTDGIPPDVTVALHLCRGNLPGGFWSGSLEPIAERIFNELPHRRFLFEWEDVAREGTYAPIKHVPAGKTMAMGLVSTKTPTLESDDEIVRRIEQASTYLDVEQLALCPQCGFASLYADHLVEAEDAQWRKLELIGRVADRIWGGV
jgi:5-methyltetrahydropteroyltriglutamate--homocysteine methyltransferase